MQVKLSLSFSGSLVACGLTVGFFLRVHAQSHQSGPGLRHHDQHLRVWKVLFPQGEFGWRVSSSVHASAQVTLANFTSKNV